MTFLKFEKQPLKPAGVVLFPKGELRVINADPHHQQEKRLVHVPAPQKEIMWVHPDLIESQQWTTVSNRKSKGKSRPSPYNVVCASSSEAEIDVTSLTDSEEEIIVLTAEQNTPLVARTHSGQQYLKKYDETVVS